MSITRRTALTFLAALPFAGVAFPTWAQSLAPDAARAFVEQMVRDVEAIVTSEGAADRADDFLALFKRVAALPEIGRFTVGVAWRSMTEAQRAAYLQAFEGYAARAYSRGIGEYKGQTIEVTGVRDAGSRGMLVTSVLRQPSAEDIRIDWLVSDRGGRTLLSDVVAEVSLSISQRETFASMLEQRGGDVDLFIRDLDQLTPGA